MLFEMFHYDVIAIFHRPIILEEIPSIFTHSFSISIDEIVNSLGKSLYIITFTTESKTIVSCNGTYICICICSCQHRISRCRKITFPRSTFVMTCKSVIYNVV